MRVKEIKHEESRKIQLEEFEPMSSTWEVSIEVSEGDDLDKVKDKAREVVREEIARDVKEMKKQKKRALERKEREDDV